MLDHAPMAWASARNSKKVWKRKDDDINNDFDLTCILATFHSQLLRTLAKKVGTHVTTVNDSMGKLAEMNVTVDKRLRARMRKMDMFCKMSRHMTQQLLDDLLSDVANSIPDRVVANTAAHHGIDNERNDLPQLTDLYMKIEALQQQVSDLKNDLVADSTSCQMPIGKKVCEEYTHMPDKPAGGRQLTLAASIARAAARQEEERSKQDVVVGRWTLVVRRQRKDAIGKRAILAKLKELHEYMTLS